MRRQLTCLVFAACCAGAGFAGAEQACRPLLVGPDDLAALDDAIIIDVRERGAFVQRRIPDAVSLEAGLLMETRDGKPAMTRPPEALTAILAVRGITRDRLVVVHGDGNTGRAVAQATRVLWTLEYLGYPHVALLDGGLHGWVAAGRPLETGTPGPRGEPADLEHVVKAERLVDRHAVLEAIGAEDRVLVDTRDPRQYHGLVPLPGLPRTGHIPTALSIPFTGLLKEPLTLFRPEEELRELLYPEGVSRDKEVIVYCNVGNTCSVVYFAYRLLGHDNVAMYDGSMAEWALDTSLPLSGPPGPR